MRVFVISDLHLDYDDNRRWLEGVSTSEYVTDALVLPGDLAERLPLIAWGFEQWVRRFRHVLYVPGNHELWVDASEDAQTSLDKFAEVCELASRCGVVTSRLTVGGVTFVPLFGWYDFTFAPLDHTLREKWMDFRACRWPSGFDAPMATEWFISRNEQALTPDPERITISFSHFLPRTDVMPTELHGRDHRLYPVLGTTRLEEQIRQLRPHVHVYGHSHVTAAVTLDGTRYVNNAFGYPRETFAPKRLVAVSVD